MKYYKFILALIVTLTSCKLNKYKNNETLCEVLVEIYDDDQQYRGMESELVDPFFKILDSVRISRDLTKKEYRALTEKQQLDYGKIAREIANKKNEVSNKVKDSLWILQSALDLKNTKLLLEIIKERGFPDIKKLDCKGYAAPFLILVHSPEEFWIEIKDILDKEIKNESINKPDYDYIMWHINGRVGRPLSPVSKEDVQIFEN